MKLHVSFASVAVALLSTASLLSSCSETAPIGTKNDPDSFTTTLDWKDHSSFANPNNPYDSAGWYHNDILRFVVQHSPGYPDTNTLLANTIQYVWPNSSPDTLQRRREFLVWTAQNRDSLAALLYKSTALTGYWNQVAGIVNNVVYSPQQVIDSLYSLETQIANTSALTSNEKGWVLPYCAVARYSMAYWSGSDAADWQVNTNVVWSKQSRPAGTVKSTVMADAEGFAAGMVEGFLTGIVGGAVFGSIGGPVGTVGGAAGGAITGSLGGGVAQSAISSGKEATGWKWPWE